jgi:hypothetical protein
VAQKKVTKKFKFNVSNTLGIIVFLLLVILGIFEFQKPSNNLNWEVGMETLPQFQVNGDQVNIQNFRDFRFTSDGKITQNYFTKTVDVSKISKVWFVQEPFVIQPFTKFGGVAHTYFVFDFIDQEEPVVISVEARRTKGEKFDAWKGLFNQFELIYVWGSEKDETIRRVVLEHNKLYMYPLQITPHSGQALFLQLVQTSQNLVNTPRFYNTLSSNCTNELAKAANKVKPDAIPLNLALFLPGYSDQELYKLGYIPTNLPFDQIKQKYYISDLVQRYANDDNFSEELRGQLN